MDNSKAIHTMSEIEYICTDLEELNDISCMLYELLEREGYQREEKFQEWKALKFARKFPRYLSAYSLIINMTRRSVLSLRERCGDMVSALRGEAEQG